VHFPTVPEAYNYYQTTSYLTGGTI
ncbi:hypothetical protein A2U01_0116733, partial [Trifolium medium]|nr:hypothetical protein [Trifolium medium]